jgi:hypothetical protein
MVGRRHDLLNGMPPIEKCLDTPEDVNETRMSQGVRGFSRPKLEAPIA